MCVTPGMVTSPAQVSSMTAQSSTSGSISTCFSCMRLNATTFLVIEDDKWREMPFIYVKVYESTLVLIDTGCGGASRESDIKLTSLREFLETYPVDDNGGQPLNVDGRKSYVVICTHCHYDHIGGIEQFAHIPNSVIWASGYEKSFIKDDLPTSSLCRFVGMETPKYRITNWADDGQQVILNNTDLGLVIYHTPGHTPDELAIWDTQERFLFVGDTMYEWAPIIFPEGGNLQDYNATLYKLRDLLKGWNAGAADGQKVKMACGHNTKDVDAEEFCLEVEKFLSKVKRGLVEPKDQGEIRGEHIVRFDREDGKVSFLGPKRYFDAFKTGVCPV